MDSKDEFDNGQTLSLEAFFARNPSVRYLRYLFIDLSGVTRVQTVTKAFALGNSPSGGLAIQSPMTSATSVDSTIFPDLIWAGRDIVRPDLSDSSLRVCTYDLTSAQVLCYVEEEPLPVHDRFARCPRRQLDNALSTAKVEFGLDFLVGFEIEFYMLEMENGIPAKPVPRLGSSYATAEIYNKYYKLLEEIVGYIEDAGIVVYRFHPEGTAGIYEISTEPLPPMEAVDALVYCQETIRAVCARNGLWATVYPKPFEKLEPVGRHIHLSISKPGLGPSFLAGLMAETPALTAFMMPSYESYTRTEMCGYGWVTWGLQNRTAAYRQIRDGYWEIRQPDGCMNPYLGLASIIYAGLEGIRKELPLVVKPKPDITFGVTKEQREELGVTMSYPASLSEALDRLAESQVLKEAFPALLINRYLDIKRREEKNFAKMSVGERKQAGMAAY
ncbi:Protein fluG [Cladobotryum mycophilum]|uniref:Protein fluG n=1 Tax=Cladobotryum mycophilum TaxID=491253 RepID=A0ABR0SB30_9HYPO